MGQARSGTKKVAVLLNPAARSGRSRIPVDALERLLRDHGVDHDLFVSSSEEHIRHLVGETARTYPAVVAVGGDTTFTIVVSELLRWGEPLPAVGMIGTGSANDIARSLGILDVADACAAIGSGRTTAMDVGCIRIDREPEPRFFLGTLSAGLAPAVNRYVAQFQRSHRTIASMEPFRQWVPGLLGAREFFRETRESMELDVECLDDDGATVAKTLEFSLLVVLNTPHYANGLKLGADLSWSDGLLDVCAIDSRGVWDTLVVISKVRRGVHRRSPKVDFMHTRRFRAHGLQPLDLLADGDLIEAVSAFEVSVMKGAIRVFAA